MSEIAYPHDQSRRIRPLRPFCRHTHDSHTCHRMLGHVGPHIERTWRADLHRNGIEEVRWYETVECTGPVGVVA